ncbi:hypothetical protein M404DRAFT_996945 [Pisolithus tinctorius Marx 270]|uniref:Uncharacterized protein n=1 Tax=Pisolithus tinctorius Marx 270 TaxID=870435 RepID=A0A0C3PJC8_PISTI|nr:hypothetical protein M404DRAFT_996945 [Pisolithus tinctorius Marx 270]
MEQCTTTAQAMQEPNDWSNSASRQHKRGSFLVIPVRNLPDLSRTALEQARTARILRGHQ